MTGIITETIELPNDDRDVLLKTDEGFIQGSYNHIRKEWDLLTLDWHGCGCCGSDEPKIESWSELPK